MPQRAHGTHWDTFYVSPLDQAVAALSSVRPPLDMNRVVLSPDSALTGMPRLVWAFEQILAHEIKYSHVMIADTITFVLPQHLLPLLAADLNRGESTFYGLPLNTGYREN